MATRKPSVRFEAEAAPRSVAVGILMSNLKLIVDDMNAILAAVAVRDKGALERLFMDRVRDRIRLELSDFEVGATMDGAGVHSDKFETSSQAYKTGSGGSHIWFSRKCGPGEDRASFDRVFLVGFDNFY